MPTLLANRRIAAEQVSAFTFDTFQQRTAAETTSDCGRQTALGAVLQEW